MSQRTMLRCSLGLVFVLCVALAGLAVSAIEPASLATPAAAASSQQAPTAPVTPDLGTPEPIAMCLTGWCASTSQCQDWFGPDWVCVKAKGATCGHCQGAAK